MSGLGRKGTVRGARTPFVAPSSLHSLEDRLVQAQGVRQQALAQWQNLADTAAQRRMHLEALQAFYLYVAFTSIGMRAAS
jgi:hypothetical protein